jgi:putative acetyltransferase
VILREERPGDEVAIGAITAAAFAGKSYSDQTEPEIIERLRVAGALDLSLVAEDDGEIVGHVAFSAVEIADGAGGWYGLGPVSVRPDRQGEGIGSALIRRGLADLAGLGACGCVLVGSPKFYPRFGFRECRTLTYPDLPVEYFMYVLLRGEMPSGIVRFHPAFYGNAA